MEWSRAWDRWIVSAVQDGNWTLVGVFEQADDALLARRRASVALKRPPVEEQDEA